MTRFADAVSLFTSVQRELAELGAKRFMEGPDVRAQRAREAFVEYFFVIAQRKLSGKDWWLSQPKDIFPDFDLIHFSDNPEDIQIFRFELVTIPPICTSCEEVLKIVKRKIEKGYPPNYNLVVFFNHPNSAQWTAQLGERLTSHGPFATIWSLFLRFSGPTEVHSAVVTRMAPGEPFHIEAVLDDPEIHKKYPFPSYMEIFEESGEKLVRLKEDFLKDFRKSIKKKRISNPSR